MRFNIFIILIFIIFSHLSAESFYFSILGDRTGGADQKQFEQVVREIDQLQPEILITVGDFVEDGTNVEEWAEPLETMKILDCPIYYVAGNHDIRDEASANTFKEKTGFNRYHSFDYQNTHFVVLDNSTCRNYEDMDEEQIKWFKKDLVKNQDKANIFVFMHKPFWADAIAEGKEDFMHDLYKKYNVDAVFTGHWHQYAYDRIDGIDYYLVGSSGGHTAKENIDMGIFYQHLWCKVDDSGLRTALIKSGNIFPKDLVTIQEEKLAYSIESKSIKMDVEKRQIEPFSLNVFLSIKNVTSKKINNEIIIKLPENWKSEKKIIETSILPDTTFKTNFQVTQLKNLFPLPEISFKYPFGREKNIYYEKKIPIVREIIAEKLENLPEIDGIINLDEIDSAYTITEFADENGEKSETDGTILYFATDSKSLYIAAKCMDDDIKNIRNKCKNRDEEVYYDDSVGFLLSPDNNTTIQFYVNAVGTIWDMKSNRKKNKYEQEWNSEFEVETKINDTYWTFETIIPFDVFGEVAIEKMKLNFKRYQPSNDKSSFFIPDWSYRSIDQGILQIK